MKPCRNRFWCADPTCGTDDRRTALGRIRPGPDPLLLLPSDATVLFRGLAFVIVCPVCGTPSVWRGRIARELQAA